MPFKWLISKLNPVKDSIKLIFFSTHKSAPFLWYTLWGFILILITKSPAKIPGASSPSPVKRISLPSGHPGSNATSNFVLFWETFLPLQSLHILPFSTISPSPLQSEQAA